MITTREPLHLQPAQAVAQTVAALGCALWFLALPFMLRELIVKQQWAMLLGLPIVLLQLNVFLRYTLRAERVYATDGGLEVFRAGSWRLLPWTDVIAIEQVSYFNSSAIRMFRVTFGPIAKPAMFYGNAHTQARFESLLRQASCRRTSDVATSATLIGRPQTDAVDFMALHSPRATRNVGLAVRAFLVLCGVSALVLIVEREWSALGAHAALTAAIALFFSPALRTVNLFATREGVLVMHPSGQRVRAPWSAVGPVETPRFAVVLPTSMARLYRLRIGGVERPVAFFSDLDGLRRLERFREEANGSGRDDDRRR